MIKEKLYIFSFVLLYLIIIFSITSNEPVIQSEETKTKEIVFWQSGAGNEREDAIKTLIAKFEKENPTIKVKLKVIPWSQKTHNKIQIAFVFNPDSGIFLTGFSFYKKINYSGVVEWLDRFIPDSEINGFFHV